MNSIKYHTHLLSLCLCSCLSPSHPICFLSDPAPASPIPPAEIMSSRHLTCLTGFRSGSLVPATRWVTGVERWKGPDTFVLERLRNNASWALTREEGCFSYGAMPCAEQALILVEELFSLNFTPFAKAAIHLPVKWQWCSRLRCQVRNSPEVTFKRLCLWFSYI